MAGTEPEAGHHIRSLAERFAVKCCDPYEFPELASCGDLVIFYSEHFDRFRDAVTRSREKGVATLYLVDGILEWRNAWENRADEPACPWTMRPVLSDIAACIGASQARILAGWGNFGRVEVVGVPRFDALRAKYLEGWCGPRSPSDTFRLLVMTAKLPGFTPEQLEITRRSLIDLRDACPSSLADGRTVDVSWRLTAGLADELGVKNQLSDLTGRELAELLPEFDAVISTPSTAGLEAMLAGRPLAWLDYHVAPQLVPAAWTIGRRSDVSQVIAELATPPEKRMQWQAQLLRDHLYLAEPASGRLISLVERMLELSAEAVRSGVKPDFSKGLLTPPLPLAVEFEHAEIYPAFHQFRERDLVVAQAEWAHARREVAHLQSELRQARSELAEAHSIFEEIHRHPIAGPIVRLRQRWMEQWQLWKDSRGGQPGAPSKQAEQGSQP